jgi:hypothetical protein
MVKPNLMSFWSSVFDSTEVVTFLGLAQSVLLSAIIDSELPLCLQTQVFYNLQHLKVQNICLQSYSIFAAARTLVSLSLDCEVAKDMQKKVLSSVLSLKSLSKVCLLKKFMDSVAENALGFVLRLISMDSLTKIHLESLDCCFIAPATVQTIGFTNRITSFCVRLKCSSKTEYAGWCHYFVLQLKGVTSLKQIYIRPDFELTCQKEFSKYFSSEVIEDITDKEIISTLTHLIKSNQLQDYDVVYPFKPKYHKIYATSIMNSVLQN